MCWGGSRSTKPCVFPCKVVAADDERYLVCAAVVAGAVPDAIGSSSVFCNEWCVCVRTSMRFLNLWLQIALEWRCPDRRRCALECLPSRYRMSFIASRCSLGPQWDSENFLPDLLREVP